MKWSIFWMWIIVVGAIAFAFGNIFYPRAKEVEQLKSLSNKTKKLLIPEINQNIDILKATKSYLEKGNYSGLPRRELIFAQNGLSTRRPNRASNLPNFLRRAK